MGAADGSRDAIGAGAVSAEASHPAGRILLIDDSATLRIIIERALTARGYEVQGTSNGRDGIEIFFDAQFSFGKAFDVIITDIAMPEVSGLDVLQNVKSRSPETPVIMWSSHSDMKMVREAMRLGAFDYVIKDEGVAPVEEAVSRAMRHVVEFRGTYQRVEDPAQMMLDVASQNKSGEVVAVSGECEIHVHFQNGRVAWATSSELKYAFTRYLVDRFGLEPDSIREVLDECRRTRKNVGETLVEWKLASQEQVREALRLQISDAMATLDAMSNARAVFMPRESDYAADFTFELHELREVSASE